jgi:AraC-like DNA-binding protein
MKFDIHLPCDELKPFIKMFAVQEKDFSETYRVLPDTGLVIGFQYKGKLAYLQNGLELPLSASGISGLRDDFRLFKNQPDTGTVLVFFRTAGAVGFFSQPLHELFGESLSLDNFMLRSELLLLEEQLCAATTDPKRISIVEKFLIGRLNHKDQDALVISAVAMIYKARGNIRIQELVKELHVSQSPFEKRFRKSVGASAKKFASIVRLKYAITRHPESQSLTELAYDAGFYDQAHFIKEFKNFTGETPETFFSTHPTE